MNNDKVAVAVVGDFKYLYKYFNNFYKNLTENGKYYGDIIVITTKLTPTFLIKSIFLNKNIHILRFKKIKFDKAISKRYLGLDTNNQPNRFKTKNFQWFKLNLFHMKLKIWDKILYLDINLTIHHDINDLLNLKINNKLFAKADGYPDYKRKLKSQFDPNQTEIKQMETKFDLENKKYFQTGLLFFDTNIINKNLITDLLDLAIKYPISITNEQGIMNLYFSKNNLYVELPEFIGNKIIYYYWMLKDKQIMITKQLVMQYK